MSRPPLRVALRAERAAALVLTMRRLLRLAGEPYHTVLHRAAPEWVVVRQALDAVDAIDHTLQVHGAWRGAGPRVVTVALDAGRVRALANLFRTLLHDARPDTVATLAAARIDVARHDLLLRGVEQLEGALLAALVEPEPDPAAVPAVAREG